MNKKAIELSANFLVILIMSIVIFGAAIALKNWMKAENIPGTIRVFGAAAEEAEGAKIYMARDGVFNGLDTCLHWHPAMLTTPWNSRSSAVDMMKIEFFGKSSKRLWRMTNGYFSMLLLKK